MTRDKIEKLISQLTLQEKIGMIHGDGLFRTKGVERLGISPLVMSDGPMGVRQEFEPDHWKAVGGSADYATYLPCNSALAATWNRDLASATGSVLGAEARGRGKDIILAPGINIKRSPLCGRNFEYFSEDPYLAGEMAVPYIQAAQANGVACCLKHFFLNNQEVDRFGVTVNVSERAVNEIYLPAFEKAVRQGGLWTIMGSYNKWLGEWCCENDSLLNGILKRRWGFDGAVVSDWGGTHTTMGAALGGLDIEMGTDTDGKTKDKSKGYNTYKLADAFERLINEGKIPMSVLDDKAARVLRTIFRTSMNAGKVIGSQCSEAHYDVCRQIGEEGIVLLQNRGGALPIDVSRCGRILVVGDNAVRNMSEGGGSSELKTKFDISPLDGLRRVYGDRVDFARGYYAGRARYGSADKLSPDSLARLRAEALDKAKSADIIIFIGGMNKNFRQDCENNDREDYNLSYGQNELIADLARVQKNIVVVTFGGNPYAMPWAQAVRAIVHCWYLGSMSGEALAGVLSGAVNPSGKLPVTFAARQADYPCFQYGREGYPGVDMQVYYNEGIFVGYRWFDTKGVRPRFPFGHGLSYTTFKYGKPVLSATSMTAGDSLTLTVPVTNTGKRAGKEVVQLYIGDEKTSVERPAKELKGFEKVALEPGETKTVSFTIIADDLSFYCEKTHGWVAEPGVFRAYVCASETDVRGTAVFELK